MKFMNNVTQRMSLANTIPLHIEIANLRDTIERQRMQFEEEKRTLLAQMDTATTYNLPLRDVQNGYAPVGIYANPPLMVIQTLDCLADLPHVPQFQNDTEAGEQALANGEAVFLAGDDTEFAGCYIIDTHENRARYYELCKTPETK